MTVMDTSTSLRLVLTVDEAADRLGIGRTLMYALIAAGDVETVRIGRLRRVPTDALDDYVLRLRGLNDDKPPDGRRPVERVHLAVVRAKGEKP